MVMRAWAIAAATADIATVALIGLATPDHSMLHDYISTMGQRGAPHVAWYVVGASVAAISHAGLYQSLWPEARTSRWGIASLGLLLGFVLAHWLAATAFPCDPGCERITATGRMHYALGFAAFVSYAIGTILFSVHAWKARLPAAIHVAGGAVFAASVWLLVADLTGTIHGLAERVTVAALAAWMIVVAFNLHPREPGA